MTVHAQTGPSKRHACELSAERNTACPATGCKEDSTIGVLSLEMNLEPICSFQRAPTFRPEVGGQWLALTNLQKSCSAGQSLMAVA